MTNEMKAIREQISARIKQMMDETNESTYEVAKVVGLSAGAITHWRTGRYMPKATETDKLAVHWKVNPRWLDGNSNDKNIMDMMEPDRPEDDHDSSYDFVERLATSDMQRLFPCGSLLFVKRMSAVPDNTVTLLELDEMRTVRRVFNKGSTFVLISENISVFPVFIKSAESKRINIIGKVVRVAFDVE